VKRYSDEYWAAAEKWTGDITASTLNRLFDAGLTDPEKVAAMTAEELAAVPGIGKKRVAELMEYFGRTKNLRH
jgi:NAD-dependent DNA ligase